MDPDPSERVEDGAGVVDLRLEEVEPGRAALAIEPEDTERARGHHAAK